MSQAGEIITMNGIIHKNEIPKYTLTHRIERKKKRILICKIELNAHCCFKQLCDPLHNILLHYAAC